MLLAMPFSLEFVRDEELNGQGSRSGVQSAHEHVASLTCQAGRGVEPSAQPR
jgi:hypothetical protein